MCDRVLCKTDFFLQMLNPDADSELTSLHCKSPIFQHRKGIARAMPDRENQFARFLLPGNSRSYIPKQHGTERPVGNTNILQPRMKQKFTAERIDKLAHVDEYGSQPIAADMRFVQVCDFLRRTELNKSFQNFSVAEIFCLCVEFSVRKRSGTALAELNIAVRVQNMFIKKPVVLRGSLLNRAAAFNDDRSYSRADQTNCAE